MPNHRNIKALLASLVVVSLFYGSFAVSEPTAAVEQIAVEGSAKADKLKQCVEPTAVMRRNHMEFILHQRDETVHKGIRGSKHSLAGCIDCHAKYDKNNVAVPVNAPKQFCAGCHEYTGTHLTCFQCHSTVPDKKPLAMNDAWLEKHALEQALKTHNTVSAEPIGSAESTN